PREITYIIDTSGSMEGVSIDQAKEALLMALDRLREGDRFNVIEFNSTTHSLYPAPMPVNAATLANARTFVRNLRARGGTEMLPALTAALSTPREGREMRQVVFLTDGAVGNENDLLHLIEQRLDDRRLFTIGIGPAPNTYFLRKAAEAGIAVLWARDKIEALMDARRNGAAAEETKRDVIGVALAHHLVSAYTSLVAVDVTPTAPAGIVVQKTALPTNLPAGLAYDAIVGVPQTATPAPLLTVAGALTLLLALGLYFMQHRGARKTREPIRNVDRIANAARRVC